ncbi:type IV secretion protein Rhs [Corallococcus exiguus]|uniref:RHS repeat-associated core domain-containing protein n=1 Tax=Corallococcus exiguus TaxID=83462 RepID=UPI001493E1BA|nr:RHS repeat-associated core domain-containing protein [Corallococcus exiguus]NPC70708.1 type IV secretion protein Rhs [Corallococcus exiguus]
MPHARRILATACLVLLGVFSGCTEEIPFAPVPDELVQQLTAERPQTGGGRSATRLSDGRWLLLGGETASAAASLQLEPGRVEPLSRGLVRARSGQTATVVPGGRVLVVGGRDATGRLVEAAEWVSADEAGFVSATEVHPSPRARHSATVLTDGRVLFAGGETADARTSDTAEVLDTRTLQVKRLSSRMQVARAGHTAVLLPDGRVLLAGGDAPGAVPTAEIFDPVRDEFVRVDVSERERLPAPDAALAMTGSLPKDKDPAVPGQVLLAVRLSHPVVQDDKASISLVGPVGEVEGEHTFAEEGRLLFFRPGQALLPATAYTLYVQGLRDAKHRELPLTTVAFTTATVAAGEGRPDTRLPRPQLGRPRATAQPVASLRPLEKRGADGRYDWRAPERPLFDDGETWLPGPENLTGHWRSREPQVTPVEPLQAAPGVTALSGRVLRLNGKPLAGVRIVVRGVATMTDAQGRFLVEGLKPGGQTLEVNGQTANRGAVRYGLFFMHVEIKEGITNPLGHTVWMTRLDPQGTVSIPSPTTEEVAVTTPAIPGLELRLPPGTVVRDRAGNLLTEINITPLPINQAPFPLPNLEMPLYFTLQPGDARFEGLSPGFSGAKLYYANYRGELPGAKANFWSYDANASGWFAYGLGSVSADGRQVIPEDGVALYGFVGAGYSNPDAPPPQVGGGCNSQCCDASGGSGGNCSGGSAGSPGSSTGGDPVQLASGQFITHEVDLVVADLVPLQVERTYRSLDLTRRQFGVGMVSNYEYFLWRSTLDFTEYELVSPDGTRIRYERISPGIDDTTAIFQTTYPGPLAGSRILHNKEYLGWDLIFRDGSRWTFNHAHRLARLADRFGNAVIITRESGNSGPIVRLDGSSGRWVEFTIGTSANNDGLATQAKDHTGRTVTYTYDTQGRLTQVTDATGKSRQYTYNTSNYMETVVDEENRLVVENEYGAMGRVSKQTLADGSTYEFTYQLGLVEQCLPGGGCNVRDGDQIVRTDVKDRSGQTRRVSFLSGYITQDIYPLGTAEERETNFELDSSTGRLNALIDAMGRRTEYEYDAWGNVTQVTGLAGSPQAVSTQYTYTSTHQIATVEDDLGQVTEYQYDAQDNLTRIEDATGRTREYTYDSQGRLLTVRAGTDAPLTFTYEGADLVAVTSGTGLTTEYFNDALGRVVARRSTGGHVDHYEYDGRDRLTRYTNATGAVVEFAYDNSGRTLSSKDARGQLTSYVYNNLGLISERMDPLGRTETYSYDSAGRLKSLKDRKGQVRGWSYDSSGAMIQAGFGATATAPTAYSNTISYVYDLGGRLIRMEDSLGPVVSQSYDGMDRPLQEVSPNGTVDYSYDVGGRLTSMTATGQSPVTYTYDNSGRVTSLVQGSRTVSFTHDVVGRRQSVVLPNGVSQHYSRDLAGQLTAITYKQGAVVVGDLSYTYDDDGNRVSVGGTQARTGLPNAVSGAVYDVASQLTTWDGQTLSYDSNGNLTSDGSRTYTWDVRNQLAQVNNGTGTLATFLYEPTGRRSRKTVSGTAEDYLYSGGNFIQVQSLAGTTDLLTGFGQDEVFSQTSSLGAHDYLTDAMRSTVALVDGSGALSATYAYEPYGKTASVGTTAGNRQTFTGREDDNTGLLYFRARYYDPSTGRFLQEEPLTHFPGALQAYALMGQGLPAYAYGSNNPLTYNDPSGLAPGDPFSSPDAAAKDAMRSLRDIPDFLRSRGVSEWGGWIYSKVTKVHPDYREEVQYYATPGLKGRGGTMQFDRAIIAAIPGAVACGTYHSHTGRSESLSTSNGQDTDMARWNKLDYYMISTVDNMYVFYWEQTGVDIVKNKPVRWYIFHRVE